MLAELPADHDLAHLRAAFPYVRTWVRAIDCGAHQGIWTRELLKRFHRVDAFEPVPANFAKLEAVGEDYDAERFKAWPMAVGAVNDAVSMEPGTENTGQWHVGGDDEATTPVGRLDDYEWPQLGLLKLDVEGYELFALQGAERTIEMWTPVVIMEVNGLHQRYGVKDGEAELWLMKRGYKLREHVGRDLIWSV